MESAGDLINPASDATPSHSVGCQWYFTISPPLFFMQSKESVMGLGSQQHLCVSISQTHAVSQHRSRSIP